MSNVSRLLFKSKLIASALLLIGVLTGPGQGRAYAFFGHHKSTAPAAECALLSPWQKAVSNKPSEKASISDWSRYQQEIWNSRRDAARNIYRAYRTGSLQWNALTGCLGEQLPPEQFQQAISTIFFEESLKELASIPGPRTQALTTAIQHRLDQDHLLPFRLVGHFPGENAPTSSKGGFHRGTGSIFMNIGLIPPNEWLVIFAHELTHAMDPKLSEAISTYGDLNRVAALAAKLQGKTSPEELSPEVLADLDGWLMAGLDRGLLAEQRAWTTTVEIYLEGLDRGAWTAIAWIESIIGSGARGEADLNSAVFAFLDPRFPNPTDGLFGTPVVAARLIELRAGLKSRL